MKILRYFLKPAWKVIKSFLILLACILLLPLLFYILPARYDFPRPMPFRGERWYNPYSEADSTRWILANFHMHSRAWAGFTNGSENKDHQVYDIYRKIGFKALSISNYQSINKLNLNNPEYIPAYEHGYGIHKNHHLCLGAKRVVWYDLPYGQNIHHKQFIINRLRPTAEIISINHPAFFKGYKPEDFSKLTGYDFIEALNGYRNSLPHWDSALSAGRPAFIMANDDMHDMSNPDEIGRRFMVINAHSGDRAAIFAALKRGAAYGVFYQCEKGESLDEKRAKFAHLPAISSVVVKQDTLTIKLDSTAYEFRFFGQHGELLCKASGTRNAVYPLQSGDTYVRTVILFSTKDNPEGLQYFLNPVMRSAGGTKPDMPQATVNHVVTALSRTGLALIFLVAVVAFIRIMQIRKKK